MSPPIARGNSRSAAIESTGSPISGVFELPDGRRECEISAPALILDAAATAGVFLDVACGGVGVCGGCAVELLEGEFATDGGEALVASPDQSRRVLACRATWTGGAFRVRVPRHSLISSGEKVVVDFEFAPAFTLSPPVRKEYADGKTVTLAAYGDEWRVIRTEAGDTTDCLYAAAVDVGTTTVVAALIDLNTGEIVDAASSYNRQIIRCDDVISRISYASDAERLEEMRRLVVETTVNRLLEVLRRGRGLAVEDISHLAVSGNSVMMHLFCGLSPASLGAVPFEPASDFAHPRRAEELGVAINADGFVAIVPAAAAYVGGDTTSDLYVCGLLTGDSPAALIDIGTNAEIVVGDRSRSIACAAPAGPAFEGHGLTCGMRAAVGAIDSFELAELAGEPSWTVIGDNSPSGVCGSGLVDFLAQARRAGMLSQAGRFTEEAIANCPRVRPVQQTDGEALAYEIVPAEDTDDGLRPIIVTESDVASLLQAKGVIAAALKIALKHLGNGTDAVGRVYLAGGFARHIDLDNAVAIGLLPDIDRERFIFIGNGSLGGAFLAAVDGSVRPEMVRLAGLPKVIELNLDPEFMDAYTMAMLLP